MVDKKKTIYCTCSTFFQNRKHQVFWNRYRPWITDNTQWIFTCLLKMAIKTLKQNVKFLHFFHISYLTAQRPALGQWQGRSLTHLMLITTVYQVWPKVHREPHDVVASQSLVKRSNEIWAENPPILSLTCYPTEPLSPKLH